MEKRFGWQIMPFVTPPQTIVFQGRMQTEDILGKSSWFAFPESFAPCNEKSFRWSDCWLTENVFIMLYFAIMTWDGFLFWINVWWWVGELGVLCDII